MDNAPNAFDCGTVDPKDQGNPAITKIIDRIPLPGKERELEQAIKALITAALRYPGHLGVTVTRPALPHQPGFRIVYRFDTCEHLKVWETSDEHARLVSAANRLTQGEPQRTVLSGLEAWFTHPGSAAQSVPPRAKIAVMTWIGIFPLVYCFATVIRMLVPSDTPALVTIGLVTMLVVLAMTYVVGPLLTKLFGKWLRPSAARSAASDADDAASRG
jgi:antibiotic biosynthesis monooxygenase (ABM) superfamily enzyme